MPTESRNTATIAVIGDVHGHVGLALDKLRKIEEASGPLSCVFQVGDFMLCTEPGDWDSVAVPQRHRRPELTPAIAAAWQAWPWPTAMIGGNHDAYARLRRFDHHGWRGKLTYTDAGRLDHPVKGLQVVGLSGIYSESQYGEGYGGARQSGGAAPQSWSEMLRGGPVKPKKLTYYRQSEIETLLREPKHPHILLTHDWPIRAPVHKLKDMPHFGLLPALQPEWAFAGHLHTYEEQQIGRTRFIGIADVTAPADQWCVLLRWDGRNLERIRL
ncbi:MAG: metallophosphoesterase [Opitutales bacterium]|nr:metallophosphoesterase [Opitutales bacterium]